MNWRRCGVRGLVARVIEESKQYVPFVVLYVAVHDNYGSRFATIAQIVFWLITAEKAHATFYSWATRTFAVNDQGVHMRSGLIFKRMLFVSWTDATSVELTQNAVDRALRCWNAAVGIGADAKNNIVIQGISEDLALEIRRRFDGANPSGVARDVKDSRTSVEASVGVHEACLSQDDKRDIVYEMGFREYAMNALSRGYPLLFLPAGVSFIGEIHAENRATELLEELYVLGALPVWAQLICWIAIIGVLTVATGAAVTWWRYGGFVVRERDGVLTVSGGAVSRETRSFASTDVQGVRIRGNVVLRLVGHRTLSVVLREGSGRSRTLDLLPAARMREIETFLADWHLAQLARSRAEIISPRSRVFGLLVLASAAVCNAIIVAFAAHPFDWIAVVAVAAAHWLMLSLCWTTIAVQPEGGLLVCERGVVWRNELRLSTKAIHVLNLTTVPRIRLVRPVFVRIHLYAGRLMSVRSALVSRAAIDIIFDSISDRQDVDAVVGVTHPPFSARSPQ